MDDAERQCLLDENARLKAEVVVLKQTIDALCRRIFGKSSEQLDPGQLELFDPPKKRPPPVPQTPDRRLKVQGAGSGVASSRGRRASRNTCPLSNRSSILLK